MKSEHKLSRAFKKAFQVFGRRGRVQQLEHAETGDSASLPLEPGEENSSPASVFSNTLDFFAEADVTRLTISCGDEVLPAIKQQVHQISGNHGTEFEEQNDTNPLPSQETLEEYNRIFDMVENSVSKNKPRGLTPELDHTKSQLKSEELLQSRTRDCLQFLIRGLTKQLGPCELSVDSKHHHVASLHLTGFKDQIDSQSQLFFDFYLSSRFDWKPCRWLESRCIIQESISQEEEEEEPGCGLIQDCEATKKRLCLLLEEGPEGRLLRQPNGASCWASIATPTVSLGTLLDDTKLRCQFPAPDNPNCFLPRHRATLCLNLALSLLQLSQHEWRQITWCPENIFFLKNHSGVVEEKERPYLSWTVRSTPLAQDVVTAMGEPSCDPHLLHFGRLLMEIRFFERVPTSAQGLELQEFLLTIIDQSFYPEDKMFVEAVRACLSTEGKMAAVGERGSNEIRDFIYRKIVVSLECSVSVKNAPRGLSKSSTFKGQPAIRSVSKALNVMSHSDGQSSKHPSSLDSSKSAKIFHRKMKIWLNENILPLRGLGPPEKNVYSKQKIRIAIIDSGANREDTRILGALRSGVIKAGRNFLPSASPDAWDDVNGHGTITTSLLLDYAPNAEIYVAKITDKVEIDSEGLFCVGRAINWAVQNWQVDIISLSFVVNDVHEGIEEELAQAIDPSYEGPGISRTIVFAAAGNSGGNAPIGWLAKRKGVIAIHATDGLGTPTNINPNPDKKDDNFATLGCDIETESTLKNGEYKKIYVTGSSYATPIAAAIAANVLEFARYNMHLNRDRKRVLYTGPCMRRIFKEMVGNRGGYDYLQPWTLWKDKKDGIREVILDAIAG